MTCRRASVPSPAMAAEHRREILDPPVALSHAVQAVGGSSPLAHPPIRASAPGTFRWTRAPIALPGPRLGHHRRPSLVPWTRFVVDHATCKVLLV